MSEHRFMPRGARPAGWVRVLGAVVLAAAGVTLAPAGASAQQPSAPLNDSVAAALSKQLMQTLPTCKVMHQLMQQLTASGAQLSVVGSTGGPAFVIDTTAVKPAAGKDSTRAVTAVVAIATSTPADTTSASKPGALVIGGGNTPGAQMNVQVIEENCSAGAPKQP